MKKIFCAFVTLLLIGMLLVGCGNKTIIDMNYTFDRAVISLPDGSVVSGKVQSWTDFADGDQIQVKIDGAVYLVHSSDIVLINDCE